MPALTPDLQYGDSGTTRWPAQPRHQRADTSPQSATGRHGKPLAPGPALPPHWRGIERQTDFPARISTAAEARLGYYRSSDWQDRTSSGARRAVPAVLLSQAEFSRLIKVFGGCLHQVQSHPEEQT